MGGGGLTVDNPVVVAAFHRALLQGGFVVLGLLTALFLVWRICRALQLRNAADGSGAPSRPATIEPAGRRFLRITFGLLWIFDGILQGQASMPLGMIPSVVQPASATSPGWVKHLVDSGSTVWSYHPVTAAASAVWIQVGIGLFLLVGARGYWSRLAGVASAAWGLIVWIFGEAFGSIFGSGLTWLFGAPGAVLFYSLAGILIALPDSAWTTARLGRWLLRALGAFYAGMALLQAWPGRGFWQGGSNGTLTGMVQQMAGTSQPHVLGSMVNAFTGFDTAHGWAVNLFVVVALTLIALTLIGGALLRGRPGAARIGLIAAIVVGLADWVLIEDLGFVGGTGTDPNSMIPMLLVLAGGYLALTRLPAQAIAETTVPAGLPWRQRLLADPGFALRISAALAAIGVTLVGAAPMAVAATEAGADPILADAISGPIVQTDQPTPAFHLTDQNGRPRSNADLHGYTSIVTFLDPVCTTDCPVIASELRDATSLLGSDASHVRLVGIDANPQFTTLPYLQAFDRQERMDALSNWEYLTGSPAQLQSIWRAFGVDVEPGVGGTMMSHSDVAFVIDAGGRTRQIINTDPGPATSATNASYAQIFARALTQVLHQ
jgi:cytochrome oxidase Cu insertion factor (SCO1/SenC/PrrC family)